MITMDFRDNIKNNQDILIIGGSGSWGKELTSQLLDRYSDSFRNIIIYSRNEFSQVNMKREFNNNAQLKFINGCIADYAILSETFNRNRIKIVFNLAALKHVGVCEDSPAQTIKINVDGVKNLIRVIGEQPKDKQIITIQVSTDKAVEPTTTYGASKMLAEKLILNAQATMPTHIFRVFRAGNVIGSNGSCIPLFINQLKENGQITITDQRMTRFFISKEEVIDSLIHSTKILDYQIMIPSMNSYKIIDIANELIKSYPQYISLRKPSIRFINKGLTEKIHESLLTEDELSRSISDGTNTYVISGFVSNSSEYKHSSEHYLLTSAEDMLRDSGYIY